MGLVLKVRLPSDSVVDCLTPSLRVRIAVSGNSCKLKGTPQPALLTFLKGDLWTSPARSLSAHCLVDCHVAGLEMCDISRTWSGVRVACSSR